MGKVLIDHSMSVDGPNVGLKHPMGDGGAQLHDWMFDRTTDADAEVIDDIYAKIAGRRPPTEEAR